MSRRKTKATPKALEPTGPVHYQASKGQYGPNYAYKVSACDILIGWPLRPSLVALAAYVKDFDKQVFIRTHDPRAKVVHFEGPLEQIESLRRWASQWTHDYREVHRES